MSNIWKKLAELYVETREEIREDYKYKEDQSVIFEEAFKSELRFPDGTRKETGTKYNS